MLAAHRLTGVPLKEARVLVGSAIAENARAVEMERREGSADSGTLEELLGLLALQRALGGPPFDRAWPIGATDVAGDLASWEAEKLRELALDRLDDAAEVAAGTLRGDRARVKKEARRGLVVFAALDAF
jgi:hypothetical protein